MTTPRQTEPSVNNVLGNILREMMRTSVVRSENTQTFPDYPGRHADILITTDGRSPVVVEAEFEPAPEAEKDARERLGLRVHGQTRTIESAVALRYPPGVETAYDLDKTLREVTLSYCVLSIERRRPTPDQDIQTINRFPEMGWLEGSVVDLADLVRLVSAPRLDVENAADALQSGIDRVATILEEMERIRPAINATIANILGLDNVPQTRRMAGAILANALVFHEHIAGRHTEIKPVDQVCGPQVGNVKGEALAAWAAILKINYWPIFGVASEILSSLRAAEAREILNTLQYTVGEFAMLGLENAHNLTGRVFQRLISDRKYLATFYTLPESAALLARLAVSKLNQVDWSDRQAIGKLRIGDFACGTGALLSAVYEQIAARHELAGGDPEKLHPVVMEEVLYGYDVLPSAVHITAATLAGSQPKVGFRYTHLDSLPYGRLSDSSVSIGSLEFLKSNSQLTFSNFSDPARRINGNGEQSTPHSVAEAEDNSFDLVIMNPPFTRNVTREGATASAVAAAFAAFNTSDDDQKRMANRMGDIGKGTCYHGNAGMASAFVALADKKLKPGGIIALVLPLTVATGEAWEGVRKMLATGYTELTALSIAANGRDMSFSSDTGMSECLVIAQKLESNMTHNQRAHFVSLTRRPQGMAGAALTARNISGTRRIRQIDDGPYGGAPLMLGDELAGEQLAVHLDQEGDKWGAVRVTDYALAQTAYALADSRLWIPGESVHLNIDMNYLGIVGDLGTYHLDITGPVPRGPFSKAAASATATYPALWNHNAKQESRVVCAPDSSLRVREGLEEKAAVVWDTASRAHINLDFTFGSQPLAVAFTERKSIGGRVWPNVIFDDDRFDYAYAIWGNCTLGLLSWWWHSNRQQSSKAGLTIRSAETLPVLDFRALTDTQLARAEEIFEEFRDKELMPAYLADADPNRALLDRRVICDLLGFDQSVYQGVRRLAQKWCAEPSVHGGKARPRNATFVT